MNGEKTLVVIAINIWNGSSVLFFPYIEIAMEAKCKENKRRRRRKRRRRESSCLSLR
jgi:hypothetical protein